MNTGKFRDRLEARRQALLARIDRDAGPQAGSAQANEEGRDARDAGDESEHDFEEDIRLIDAERATAMLKRVEDALARIAAGTYGRCIDCEEPIEERRLRAVPEAERCAADQERYEKERAAGPHATM